MQNIKLKNKSLEHNIPQYENEDSNSDSLMKVAIDLLFTGLGCPSENIGPSNQDMGELKPSKLNLRS